MSNDLLYFLRLSEHFYDNKQILESMFENEIYVVYQKKYLVVLHRHGASDFIVFNLLKPYKLKQGDKCIDYGHTHLKSREVAQKICDNIVSGKCELIKARWLIERYKRVCDKLFYEKLMEKHMHVKVKGKPLNYNQKPKCCRK
jgi:hypothetical protein